MTNTKKVLIQLAVTFMLGATLLVASPNTAVADIDIPTVDEAEIDRMQTLTAEGPGSEGCNTLAGEIRSMQNNMTTWKADLFSATTKQQVWRAADKLRAGFKWLQIAGHIYENNCETVRFQMSDGAGPAS